MPDPLATEPTRHRTITWKAPIVDVAKIAAMSGLEYLQSLVDANRPPPIAELLNFNFIRIGPGVAVFAGTPAEYHYNPIGVVHGGLVCTLADSAAGCAVHTTLEPGVAYTSVDITVNYLRPVTLNSGTLVVTGKVVRSGRRMALAAVEVHDGAGRLVATATSNCPIMTLG